MQVEGCLLNLRVVFGAGPSTPLSQNTPLARRTWVKAWADSCGSISGLSLSRARLRMAAALRRTGSFARGGPVGTATCTWVWLKFKQELRRFWSMVPLTRVPFWYRFFESHTGLITIEINAWLEQVPMVMVFVGGSFEDLFFVLGSDSSLAFAEVGCSWLQFARMQKDPCGTTMTWFRALTPPFTGLNYDPEVGQQLAGHKR